MTRTNQDETAQRPRVKRSRGQPKLYITFLPEGRGGSREEKGSVPLEVDVEAHIQERTDCEPGLYRIEKKRSGEFSGEVLFYSKDEVSDFESPASIGILGDAGHGPEGSEADIRRIVAATVNATLEARERHERGQLDPMEQFRQMRELLKEEREEMQRQMAGASSQQQDPLVLFERVVELQKKLQPEAPDPDDALTSKDRAQLMLIKETGVIPEFMRSMREMLRAPENAVEPRSLVEKALDYVSGWTPYIAPVLAPVLGGKVAELLSHVNTNVIAQRMAGTKSTASASGPTPSPAPNAHADVSSAAPPPVTATPPPNPPQPSSQQSAEEIALEKLLIEKFGVVVAEMRLFEAEPDDDDLNTAHIRVAAAALQELPLPLLQQLFSLPSAMLVVNLSQLNPDWVDVSELSHAAGFINDLKLELRQRLEKEPIAKGGNGFDPTGLDDLRERESKAMNG